MNFEWSPLVVSRLGEKSLTSLAVVVEPSLQTPIRSDSYVIRTDGGSFSYARSQIVISKINRNGGPCLKNWDVDEFTMHLDQLCSTTQ